MKKLSYLPWKDLNPFILSQIFCHLSLHDQLFGPPFVCHSWLSASLHTIFNHPNLDLCAIQNLDNDHQIYNQQLSRYNLLLKLAIKNCKNWVSLYLPSKKMPDFYTIMHIAENTPNISSVFLSSNGSMDVYPIFMALMYWKNLTVFHAPIRSFQFLTQLVDYCKNIVELGVHGVFSVKEVSCIVEGFPRLKILDLSDSTLSISAFRILLDGRSRFIRELNVSHCLFVDENGKDMREDYLRSKAFKNEVVRKVSGIKCLKKFMHCLGKSCDQCNHRSLDSKLVLECSSRS